MTRKRWPTNTVSRPVLYEDIQIVNTDTSPFLFMFQEQRAVGGRDSVDGLVLGLTFADDRDRQVTT